MFGFKERQEFVKAIKATYISITKTIYASFLMQPGYCTGC